MDKKEIKEIIGSNLPSGIDFSFSDDRLEIVLDSKSVFGNMQDDSSAFEGWILCIKSELENKGYRVKKVNIKFRDSFQMGDSPKAKGNNKVGIISELLYYTNMVSDILNGRFSFEPNSKDYRGVETLKKSIGKIKHLEGVFLTDTLHPLISENKKKLADAMAFVSGAVNVSFTFEKNTDDISDYSDYMGR